MDILDQVLACAAADPNVRGVILSGSRARGTENARSDYDVTIVVAGQTPPWRHSTRTNTLDEVVCTVEALAEMLPLGDLDQSCSSKVTTWAFAS